MTILDDDPLELDRVNHVGILVLYSIQIIRLRISKLKKGKRTKSINLDNRFQTNFVSYEVCYCFDFF